MGAEPRWPLQLTDAGCSLGAVAAGVRWYPANDGCSLGAVVTAGPWLQPLGRCSCRTLVADGRWLQPRGLWSVRAWVVKVVERFMWRAAVCEAGRTGFLVSFVFVVSG